MRAALGEGEARAGDQVAHRLRHDDLAGLGLAGDARADVDRDAAELLTDDLAFAGMQAGADLAVSISRPRNWDSSRRTSD